jgi:hypothetical protein
MKRWTDWTESNLDTRPADARIAGRGELRIRCSVTIEESVVLSGVVAEVRNWPFLPAAVTATD